MGGVYADIMYTYTITNFPYEKLCVVPTVMKGKRGYLNIAAAFDIETNAIYCEKRATCELLKKGECEIGKCKNWIEPYAYMNCWQAAIEDDVVLGDTWEEVHIFIDRLMEYTDKNKRLVIYIHNAAYEFQFLRSHFELTEVFARKERAPMKFVYKNIEFRCSYLLSNMSLKKWCENTPGVTHGKLVGAYDYDKIRYPGEEQSEEEMNYRINDVLGITECLRVLLKDDTIATIPLTSTGFVRRDAYNKVRKNKKERRKFERSALSLEQYELCKYAFRGGNTHANCLYVGEVMEGIESNDISSSYPYVMMTEPFPYRFIKESVGAINKYDYPDYSYIGIFRYTSLHYKGDCGIPYISVSHCQKIKNGSVIVNDNGRVMEARQVLIALTNIDRDIIREQYEFAKEECSVLYVAKNEYLPTEIRQLILELFEKKSRLKDVAGKEYEYMKSKNKLNGVYGMMVTDILQDEVTYKGTWTTHKVDKQKALDKYYKNKKSFLTYQHGIFVTAYARRNLQRGLDMVGKDVLYCDTDSIKCIRGHKKDFEKLNESIIDAINKAPIPPRVKVDGKMYYMGTWEYEGTYEKFITWGAKKYLFKKDGKVETTVSGLGKVAGANYFETHPVEDFKPGLVFYPSGRLNAFYNDCENYELMDRNGKPFTTGSNVALIPGTYKLGVTGEYEELLEYYKNI